MKIFKFGGASVKDAKGVRNLLNVLQKTGYEDILLVISAMGKMTNAFEKVSESYFNKKDDLAKQVDSVKQFHLNIARELFSSKDPVIFKEINNLFNELNVFFKNNTSTNYNYIYDQIVSKAEILSTKICSYYLLENQIKNEWLDVRSCILTDKNYRSARVNWTATCKRINSKVERPKIYVTQGFIAGNELGETTTLGREGSDYTAGIFAYCLNADEVVIFKDVQGVLNADPRVFDKTILLDQVSYREAIEMAFYGASVIHPKTLQPLQRKEIPLHVRSFKDPLQKGTSVKKGLDLIPQTSCFIVKYNQILLSISDKEFSFIMENDISYIFELLHRHRVKVNLIQNSAISFSVSIEDNFNNFNALLQELTEKFRVLYNKDLILYTIRHYTKSSIKEIENNREVILKQLSRETAQILIKE
ncbi:MAG: aspartate kinase [Flavobacteriia bacterium]|nr:MAG: aspartate kinase [Flavobacteriia bacterium]